MIGGYTEVKKDTDAGHIVSWSGVITDIPSGWALCDGNNGTCDLRGRFVKSIINSSDDPGNEAGTNNFALQVSQMPSHSHNGSTNYGGSHSHGVSLTGRGAKQTSNSAHEMDPFISGIVMVSTYAGSHTHPINLSNTGSATSVDNTPSHYEVAFIEKL